MLASSRGPRAAANTRGRDLRPKSRRCAAVGLRNAPAGGINPAPTNKFYVLGQPGTCEPGNVANLCRGRCLHRPADLAPPRTPAGGINPAPTNRGKARSQPGKREPGNAANRCRGRFHIGPVCGGTNTPVYRSTTSRPCAVKCAGERKATRSWPVAAVRPW